MNIDQIPDEALQAHVEFSAVGLVEGVEEWVSRLVTSCTDVGVFLGPVDAAMRSLHVLRSRLLVARICQVAPAWLDALVLGDAGDGLVVTGGVDSEGRRVDAGFVSDGVLAALVGSLPADPEACPALVTDVEGFLWLLPLKSL